MVTLVGGTVADVYTGTWIEANVVIEGERIVYVGPDARGEEIDVSGKVLVPGYIEPHTHPWCLYSPASLLEVAVPDGTTTLVYDNLFFYLSHGVDGLRSIVDQMNAAPAHVKWVARISPQSAYPDEAERFAIERIAPLFSWPEVVASGEITNWMSVAQRRAAGRGRDRRREGRAAARRGPQRGRVLPAPERALGAAGISVRPRGDHGRGGAGAAAARDVDDAAPVLAAAGPRADAARAGAGGGVRAAADVHHRRRRAVASTPSAG